MSKKKGGKGPDCPQCGKDLLDHTEAELQWCLIDSKKN